MKKAKQSSTKKRRGSRAPLEDRSFLRVYKGKTYDVQVKSGVIMMEGKTYKSLTALAQHITGYKAISGPAFFKLGQPAAAV